jgi:hypothetical protein
LFFESWDLGQVAYRDQKIIQAKLFSNLLPKRELHLLASIFQVGKKWTHQQLYKQAPMLRCRVVYGSGSDEEKWGLAEVNFLCCLSETRNCASIN